ncbi:hypothetical protein AGMMS49940_17020 [Spirochaetia bacterium]|nr:hypothetical protein AGMMS49940_17020 [Spirochaetia bacterium]
MLLTVQGYFEGDRFISADPVRIPERKKAIVTILDEDREESADDNKMSPAEIERRMKVLDELEKLLDESERLGEEMPEFTRMHLRGGEI